MRAFLTLLAIWLVLTLTPAAAQVPLVPGQGGDVPEAEPDPLADTLRRAAEQGVPVIVVDTEGRLVQAGGPAASDPDTAPDVMGGSVLM